MDWEPRPPGEMWIPSLTRKKIFPPPSTARQRGMKRPRGMEVAWRVHVDPSVPVTVARALKKLGMMTQPRLMEKRTPRPPDIAPFTSGSDGSVTSIWFVSGAESKFDPLHQ